MAVSLKDIGKRIGVSSAAVSLALRDSPRISIRRREEIQRVASEMGYFPNLVAGALRTRRTFTVGLITYPFDVGVLTHKIKALEQRLSREGYQVFLCCSEMNINQTLRHARSLLARQVDGLIIADGTDFRRIRQDLLPLLASAETPCILVEMADDPRQPALPCVCVDRVAGMEKMGRYLLETGHHDVMAIYVYNENSILKLTGLQAGMAGRDVRTLDVVTGERGLLKDLLHRPYNPDKMPKLGVSEVEELTYRTGAAIARMDHRPSAIVATADSLAMMLINGLIESGVRVPEDLSVVSFDGTEEARFFRPALTTVQQPAQALADKACDLLMTMLRGESVPNQMFYIKPELIIRKSSRPLIG
ncbi:MAG: LacI family DNA-binding transcriptional regulator [Phycisphaeraceae bacterium]|nr:LacI family DNA-binding transcriptional regulator [Phycisphaeraceae bacterium]